jgi:uncharacterized membrane protein
MNKNEFMRELEGLLLDISFEERQEALSYYENYFEDAGIEREQIIISELGSPAKVAAIIKADLGVSSNEARNRGYFTEKGYEDELLHEPKYEIIGGSEKLKDADNSTKAEESYYNHQTNNGHSDSNKEWNNGARNNQYGNNKTGNQQYTNDARNYYTENNSSKDDRHHQYNSGSKLILIIILCIFGLPFIIPVIAVVFSLFVAVGALFLGIWIAVTVISIAFTFTGIGLTVVGIIRLFTIPIIGLSLTGAGLVLFGIGLLFTMATIGLSTKVIPVVFRGFINICRLPFRNRRVPA